MPGISRLKNWVAREVLVYSDLNNEFDNIILNLEASNLDGYSATVAQMRETTDPGSVGSESLALRISDEIERLRFAINRIIGKTYWYEAPDSSIEALYEKIISNVKSSLLFSGGNKNKKEIAYRLARNFTDSVAVQNLSFSNAGKWSDYSFESATGVFAAILPTKDNILNPEKNTFSFWVNNLTTGDGILYNHFLNSGIVVNNSGYLNYYITLPTPSATVQTDFSTKEVRSITGNSSVVGIAAYRDFALRFALNGVNGVGTDIVNLQYDGSSVGTNLTGTIPINSNSRGGHWFFFAKRNPNIAFVKYYNMAVVPSSGTLASPLTLVTTGGSATVSDGVLRINALAAEQLYYKTANTASSLGVGDSMAIRLKMRVSADSFDPVTNLLPNQSENGITIAAQFPGNSNAGYRLTFNELGVFQLPQSGIAGIKEELSYKGVSYDFSKWTVVDLVYKNSIGTLSCDVYANGSLIGFFSPYTDPSATSEIAIGKTATDGGAIIADIEYIGITGSISGSSAPVVPNGSVNQYLSDISIIDDYVSDQILLNTIRASAPENTAPIRRDIFNSAVTSHISSATVNGANTTLTYQFPANLTFLSDGRTPISVSYTAKLKPTTNGGIFEVYAGINVSIFMDYDYAWTGSTTRSSVVSGPPSGRTGATVTALAYQRGQISLFDVVYDVSITNDDFKTYNIVVNDSRVYPAGLVSFSRMLKTGNENATSFVVVREEIAIS